MKATHLVNRLLHAPDTQTVSPEEMFAEDIFRKVIEETALRGARPVQDSKFGSWFFKTMSFFFVSDFRKLLMAQTVVGEVITSKSIFRNSLKPNKIFDQQILNTALLKLDNKSRLIYSLDKSGYSRYEIAQVLNITPERAKEQLAKSKIKVKKIAEDLTR